MFFLVLCCGYNKQTRKIERTSSFVQIALKNISIFFVCECVENSVRSECVGRGILNCIFLRRELS